ncbi:MAG: hypothetical protein GYA61_07620 [Spirochaetales bacterium]|nr:C4-type zinc ribbon domain-containing protein [Exilispira sp.]NMC68077.1 hypothetical protein [Spirochaetales bacterium]
MESTIANLIKAQEIQKSITYLEKEIELMPARREEALSKIENNEKKVISSKQEIVEIEKEIENISKLIEEKKKEIENLDNDTSYSTSSKNEKEEKRKDLGMQIDNYKKKIEDLEEQKHKKYKDIQTNEATLKVLKEELIKEEENIKNNRQKKIDELQDLLNKKKEILANIDDDIIEKFDRIFRNKGDLAIVPVYNNYCSGCNMILPFSLINKVKAQKEIVFCPYCSRMLYFSEDEIV